jgi:hypothetical protein
MELYNCNNINKLLSFPFRDRLEILSSTAFHAPPPPPPYKCCDVASFFLCVGSVHLSTTTSTWTGLGLNPVGERPTTPSDPLRGLCSTTLSRRPGSRILLRHALTCRIWRKVDNTAVSRLSYGLDGLGSESRREQEIFLFSDTSTPPLERTYSGYWGSFLG